MIYKRLGKNQVCEFCKKEFYVIPSLLGKVKFCNKECFYKKTRSGDFKKLIGNIIICIVCGKKKYYTKYKIDNLHPKYCSNKCKHSMNVRKYGYKECELCKKRFYYPPHKQKRNTRFCSKHCSATAIGINNLGTRMLGKKHSLKTRKRMSEWQIGRFMKKFSDYKQKTSSIIRERIDYLNWRTSIFKRDSFTCSKCNQIGGTLNVHHIIPLSSIVKYINKIYGKENLLENVVKFPLTFDISNGITLCIKCHKNTDTFLVGIKHELFFSRINNYINKT